MSDQPVFILGVPRSGTTLLRIVLDSHPLITGLPETPWLLGSYETGAATSLRQFVEAVGENRFGLVKNVPHTERGDVVAAGRAFIETLLAPYRARTGKTKIVFKTPGDIRYLEFLLELFPHAQYIHICRDGRDVANSLMSHKGTIFEDLGDFGRVSFLNGFRRWYLWESKIRDLLGRAKIDHLSLRYEDFVANPEIDCRRLCEFLGVPFDERMLRYNEIEHNYPSWEAGSKDVKSKSGISRGSVSKWRSEKPSIEILYTLRRYKEYLTALGYSPVDAHPAFLRSVAIFLFPLYHAALEWLIRSKRKLRRTAQAVKQIFAGAKRALGS